MLYCDYNSTSPLAPSVIEGLVKGDVFANPSSQHFLGKNSFAEIKKVESFLKTHFNLPDHKLIFHSGTTEAVNTFFQGIFKPALKKSKPCYLFYFPTDHACISAQVPMLEELGVKCVILPVEANGLPAMKEVMHQLSEVPDEAQKILNFTWVNNESGVIWELNLAHQIKDKFNIFIHVDATQTVGKIHNYRKLDPQLDCYSYSGHKFGSLKGVGFSLYNPTLRFQPLLWGGSQQQGLRAGTLNLHGIMSLKWSLEWYQQHFDQCYQRTLSWRAEIESHLLSLMNGRGGIFAYEQLRANNTIFYFLNHVRSEILLAAFDLEKVALSSTSACSSGSFKPSSSLSATGLHHLSQSGIRCSFNPLISIQEVMAIKEIHSKVISRFCQS